jgi:5-(carboxyamino)imidazole ribonucleotide synthase
MQQPVQRLGVIGGGQLARMLAQAAIGQGLSVAVLSPSREVPAAIDGVELIIGELDDEDALDRLCGQVDCITIENEFLALDRIAAVLARRPHVRMHPSSSSIAVAQDKLAQKRLFDRLGVATAAWETVEVGQLRTELDRLRGRFPGGFVLKWSRFGYDGRGNLPVQPSAPPDFDEIDRFCAAAERVGARIYAEQFIDFRHELALVSTRSLDRAQEFFPLVVSRQEHGVCREVYGPATRLGFASDLERQAVALVTRIGDELDLCGSFALEFFLDADDRLLANEMAPRVHNTGHYTLFGDEPSQFDLHVQAVTGRPLQRPAVEGLVVMRNFLGPRWLPSSHPCPRPQLPPPPGTSLVWYDKASVTAGRKMGHLTGRANTAAELDSLRAEMADYEGRLWEPFEPLRAVS